MNYHKIQIRRYIILYIIVFGLLGSIAIISFAYTFSLSVIQKTYSEDYVQATFDDFDSNMTLLITKLNMLIFNIASDSSLLNIVYDGIKAEQADEMYLLLEDMLSGYDEIVQVDILSDSSERYTFLSPNSDQQTTFSLPTDSFISSLVGQKTCLYDYVYLDENGSPILIFGRNTALGNILFYIKEPTVRSLYSSHFLSNSMIYLSCDGKVVSCSDSDFIGIQTDVLLKTNSITSPNKGSTVYSQTIKISALTNHLELTYFMSDQDIHRTSNILIRTLLLLSLLTILVCILLAVSVSKKLNSSLENLQKNLNLFGFDYNHHFHVSKGGEIEALEAQFVQMSDRLRDMFLSLEKEKESKRIAELKALQSQINPHFIYNSIDAISWMTKLHKPYQDIEKLAYNLGLFFRLGLHKGDTFITVAEELQHVKSYLAIEQLRFPDKFDVTMECNPEIFDLKVIKIILQPIVENSINHGFNGITYRGKLSIRIFVDPFETETIVFEVTDNGIGTEISGSLPKSKSPSDGYALKNVNERLCLEYGSTAALSFTSKPGEGTVVSFRISKSKMFVL